MATNEIFQNGALIDTVAIPDNKLIWTFDFISRFSSAEQVAINSSVDENVVGAKNRFYTALQIDPYSTESQQAKALLVATGLLTQVRADAIFI